MTGSWWSTTRSGPLAVDFHLAVDDRIAIDFKRPIDRLVALNNQAVRFRNNTHRCERVSSGELLNLAFDLSDFPYQKILAFRIEATRLPHLVDPFDAGHV